MKSVLGIKNTFSLKKLLKNKKKVAVNQQIENGQVWGYF